MIQSTYLTKYINADNRPFIVCLVISIFLFILFNFCQACFVWIYLFLKPFIYGISSFKINFLLVYISILCCIFLSGKGFKAKRIITVLQKVNFISIILAAAAGFWTFLSVTQKLQLPFREYAFHFKGHQHTINYFAHTHSTKTPMFFLVKLLNMEYLLEKFDTAMPLAEYVNYYAVGFLVLFFLISLISFLFLTRTVVIKWEKGYRLRVFILYAFASCHILKCLIDGGPFSYDFLVSVIAIHILYHSNSIASLLNTLKRYRWQYIVAILLFYSFYACICSFPVLAQTVINNTFFICIYALLFLSMVARHIRLTKVILIFILCCIYCVFFLDMATFRDVKMLMQKIQGKDKVFYYDHSASNMKEAWPSIIDYSSKMKGRRIIDVYKELGENPFRNHYVVILKDEEQKIQEYNGCLIHLKILKKKDIIIFPSNDYIRVHNIRPLRETSKQDFWIHLSFSSKFFPSLLGVEPSIIHQNNEHAILYYLNHYLTSCGITEYVIILYYSTRVAWL